MAETGSGPEVVIVARDGETETDITEAVKILYDIVHASMDWGSGFLDADEVGHIAALADACGFGGIDEIVQAYPTDATAPFNLPSPEWGRVRRENVDAKRREIADRAKTVRAAFRSIPKVDPR